MRPTAPVVVPGTEGSSDPPRCRGLGQHFDVDIANGKTSLPVWPELLYDLCERARCRFCLLVCFVLLFLLAFLFLLGQVRSGSVRSNSRTKRVSQEQASGVQTTLIFAR